MVIAKTFAQPVPHFDVFSQNTYRVVRWVPSKREFRIKYLHIRVHHIQHTNRNTNSRHWHSLLSVIYKKCTYMWGLISIYLRIFFTSAITLPLKFRHIFKYPTTPLQQLLSCLTLLEILVKWYSDQEYIKCLHFLYKAWGYLGKKITISTVQRKTLFLPLMSKAFTFFLGGVMFSLTEKKGFHLEM